LKLAVTIQALTRERIFLAQKMTFDPRIGLGDSFRE
jgi:hypothetical protein